MQLVPRHGPRTTYQVKNIEQHGVERIKDVTAILVFIRINVQGHVSKDLEGALEEESHHGARQWSQRAVESSDHENEQKEGDEFVHMKALDRSAHRVESTLRDGFFSRNVLEEPVDQQVMQLRQSKEELNDTGNTNVGCKKGGVLDDTVGERSKEMSASKTQNKSQRQRMD